MLLHGIYRIRGRIRERVSFAAPQYGGTSLHLASQNSHLEVVGALLTKDANLEAEDDVNIARACALSASR
jgi:hypothetical protein